MTSGPRAPPSLDHRLQGSTEGRQAPGEDDPRVHPQPPTHSRGGARGQRPACWSPVVPPQRAARSPQARRRGTTSHGPERRRADPAFQGRQGPQPAPRRTCPCIMTAAALTAPPSPGGADGPRRHTSLGLSPRQGRAEATPETREA